MNIVYYFRFYCAEIQLTSAPYKKQIVIIWIWCYKVLRKNYFRHFILIIISTEMYFYQPYKVSNLAQNEL